MCCGSVTFVRFRLVEVEVSLLLAALTGDGEVEEDELLLNVGDDAADGVNDDDVQISKDALGFTPIGVG